MLIQKGTWWHLPWNLGISELEGTLLNSSDLELKQSCKIICESFPKKTSHFLSFQNTHFTSGKSSWVIVPRAIDNTHDTGRLVTSDTVVTWQSISVVVLLKTFHSIIYSFPWGSGCLLLLLSRYNLIPLKMNLGRNTQQQILTHYFHYVGTLTVNSLKNKGNSKMS